MIFDVSANQVSKEPHVEDKVEINSYYFICHFLIPNIYYIVIKIKNIYLRMLKLEVYVLNLNLNISSENIHSHPIRLHRNSTIDKTHTIT